LPGIKRIEPNLKQASEKISFLFTATLAVEVAGPVVCDPGKTNKDGFYFSLAALRDNADGRQDGRERPSG
jgi:hypothetical protein